MSGDNPGTGTGEDSSMNNCFAIPPDSTPRAREAAEIILAEASVLGFTGEGSSRMFYSNAEWRERGERYGRNADLIVVHDDTGMLGVLRAAKAELERKGFYCEGAETWYSIVLNQPLYETGVGQQGEPGPCGRLTTADSTSVYWPYF